MLNSQEKESLFSFSSSVRPLMLRPGRRLRSAILKTCNMLMVMMTMVMNHDSDGDYDDGDRSGDGNGDGSGDDD